MSSTATRTGPRTTTTLSTSRRQPDRVRIGSDLARLGEQQSRPTLDSNEKRLDRTKLVLRPITSPSSSRHCLRQRAGSRGVGPVRASAEGRARAGARSGSPGSRRRGRRRPRLAGRPSVAGEAPPGWRVPLRSRSTLASPGSRAGRHADRGDDPVAGHARTLVRLGDSVLGGRLELAEAGLVPRDDRRAEVAHRRSLAAKLVRYLPQPVQRTPKLLLVESWEVPLDDV